MVAFWILTTSPISSISNFSPDISSKACSKHSKYFVLRHEIPWFSNVSKVRHQQYRGLVETRERAFACWRSESKLLRGIAGWFLDLGQPCYPYSPSSTPSAPRTNEHSPIPSVSFRFILLEAPRRLETSSNYREEGKESSKSRFLRSLLFSFLSLSFSHAV